MVCEMNRALWLTMLFAACGPETLEGGPADTTAPEQQQSIGSHTAPLTGFPCDVRAALQANCASCHTGAYYLTHFTSREDFLQPRGDGLFGTEVALRLRPDARAPMPPASMEKQPTLAERQLIDGWIQSGMPPGECGPLTR